MKKPLILLLAVLSLAVSTSAQPVLTMLAAFNLTNGAQPYAALTLGNDGNFYGTTLDGGNLNLNNGFGVGTVFRMSANGTLTTLVSFAITNGMNPQAGLTLGKDGNFYGTTQEGGNLNYNNGSGAGTVFRVSTNGVLTTLASFANTNGTYPVAGLTLGTDGNFYGTTEQGGSGGWGTVFRMTTNGVLTTLVSFASTNGSYPLASLCLGTDGNFYGTTERGGNLSLNGGQGYGTVFRVTTNGLLGTLASFANTNGAQPVAGLALGTDGNFYGTTEEGGNLNYNDGFGGGTVFRVSTNGALSMLVSFANTNGAELQAGLILGGDGNFYGTTVVGGNLNLEGGIGAGSVFELTADGVLTSLVAFGYTNGAIPFANLTIGNDGNLYGSTGQGGPAGYGTVFKLTLPSTQSPFTYTINSDDSLNITGYTGSNSLVSIPGTINGLPVTSIGYEAFMDDSSLTSVTIPNSVTNVGVLAFVGCLGMTNLTLGTNLATIGNVAFENCFALGSVIIPNSVTALGQGAFASCESLTNVTIGTNITALAGTFDFCVALANVTIPNSVTNIGYAAFEFDSSLTNVVIGTSVTTISTEAFGSCSALPGIAIPASVTAIGPAAFEGCSSLAVAYFQGNAPVPANDLTVFFGDNSAIAYYLPGTTGWGSTFDGIPTALWSPYHFSLGTTNLLEGPRAGLDSVVVAASAPTGAWTASANASWLHFYQFRTLSAYYGGPVTNGTGSGNVIINFDANRGPTRTGTLTIAGQTVTITQAGLTYVQAPPGAVTTLVPPGNQDLTALIVDHSGNVYFCDYIGKQLEEWTPTNNNVSILANSGVSAVGLALDAAGNVYIADYASDAIEKWTAATGNISTVVPNLNQPYGVAVDGLGNIYIADTYNNATEEWLAASNSLTTLISSTYPEAVAVDVAGNVYVGNRFSTVQEWSAATETVSTLVSGLNFANGVAVDGSGNVYIADFFNNAVREWSPAYNALITLASSGVVYPFRVAVDGAGNVFFIDQSGIRELPHAFVDPTPKIEPLSGGSDSLPVVLPATQNLQAPFAPTSDSPWLTITGVTNGVVSFSFAAGSNRVAHINLLGEAIPVIQPTYLLGTTNLVEGPGAGYDSVIVAVTSVAPWTATANASWLNVIGYLGEQGAVAAGSQLAYFSIAANPGPTRTGTLTIAGQTLTVTQAGSNYVQAPGPVTGLITSGLNYPVSVAVDGAGDVYVASLQNNAITKWTAANDSVANVVSSGLKYPWGVAVDPYGNLYISDNNNQAIKEWVAASNTVITLATGLNYPAGVAVDAAGNVYFADTHNYAIKEWIAASNTVTTILSTGSSVPAGVAVDAAGNVYFSANNNTIEEFSPGDNAASSLVTSGLNQPSCLAVDGSGNVYIADTLNNAVKKWSKVYGQVTTLAASGLNEPSGVAVDATGNVYFTELGNNLLEELPRAFVDPTSKTEVFGAGSDFLPPVLPNNENLLPPFTPASDQSWLTVNSTAGGVVNFSFALANTNRTAHLNVLGQSIPVSQVINVYNGSITNSQFQFAFTNYIPNASYNVLSATNLTTPLANWTEVAAAFNLSTGYFQFAIPLNTTNPARFYRLHLIQ